MAIIQGACGDADPTLPYEPVATPAAGAHEELIDVEARYHKKNLKCTHKQTNNLYKQSCSRIAFLSDWRFSGFSRFLEI